MIDALSYDNEGYVILYTMHRHHMRVVFCQIVPQNYYVEFSCFVAVIKMMIMLIILITV